MLWIAALILVFAPLTVSDEIREIAETGRVVEMAELPSERLTPPVQIAPGLPPGLSFRSFDSTERGRSANLGLVIDDAGH